MNDVHEPEGSESRKRELVDLFLSRTLSDVEQMRRNVPRLVGGDDAAWRELKFHAQRICGVAQGLDLGLLSACARELGQLAEERFSRASVDAHFLLSVTTAIEMLAIELSESAACATRDRR
jgi:hypothetical protein